MKFNHVFNLVYLSISMSILLILCLNPKYFSLVTNLSHFLLFRSLFRSPRILSQFLLSQSLIQISPSQLNLNPKNQKEIILPCYVLDTHPRPIWTTVTRVCHSDRSLVFFFCVNFCQQNNFHSIARLGPTFHFPNKLRSITNTLKLLSMQSIVLAISVSMYIFFFLTSPTIFPSNLFSSFLFCFSIFICTWQFN